MACQWCRCARQSGITEQTFYRWKKQFVGLEIDQVRQSKRLQKENGKLKKLVAERSLDKSVLRDVLSKLLKLSSRRPVVHYRCDAYRAS